MKLCLMLIFLATLAQEISTESAKLGELLKHPAKVGMDQKSLVPDCALGKEGDPCKPAFCKSYKEGSCFKGECQNLKMFCNKKPDGTPCRKPCRNEDCFSPYTACYKGKCLIKPRDERFCIGKADGTSCKIPFGGLKGTSALCIRDICVPKSHLETVCLGKHDGTPCRKPCRNEDCFPPYTACYKDKCLIKPRDERFCIGKPQGASCKIPFGKHKGTHGVCISDSCVQKEKNPM
jgi:hypothetical protein